jgi:hypothetical protein
MDMDMNAVLLGAFRGPYDCGCRSPDCVITTGVFIQIDSGIRRFVPRILRKLVMERLEWSRDDWLLTPRAVASAVSAEMFFVWFVREIAEIEMRVSTGRTVYAALKKSNAAGGVMLTCVI